MTSQRAKYDMPAHESASVWTTARSGWYVEGDARGGMPKLSVLLGDDEAERLEAFCRERGHKKSTLVARLIRDHLNREGFAMQRPLFGRDGSPPDQPKRSRP
jgi:hypothetical protein